MQIIEKANPLTDKMFQVMDELGNVVAPEFVPDWNDEKLREIYATMVFLRMADQKLIALQRQGRCGSYASIEGQEAGQVGSGLALDKKDWVFPAFRELAICYVHGAPLEKIYLYWMGNEWGSNVEVNIVPVSIPVGSHPMLAVGTAWSMKLQKKNSLTVSYFGDGATSTGDFYEAINFAGVLRVPTIFYCQNNQWAISTPRKKQTAARTLAQKAIAAGIPGIQIDGNDIFAVYAVTKEAAERAKNGQGATLIESMTYRLGDHTTSDDAKKYRDPAEVTEARKRDPILRFKLYLQKKNLWSEEFENKIIEDSKVRISVAVEKAESTPAPTQNEMFDFVFEKPTPELLEQKAFLQNLTQK